MKTNHAIVAAYRAMHGADTEPTKRECETLARGINMFLMQGIKQLAWKEETANHYTCAQGYVIYYSDTLECWRYRFPGTVAKWLKTPDFNLTVTECFEHWRDETLARLTLP